jgi:hypothetical protein
MPRRTVLALEHVEDVAVAAVDMQAGALLARREARQRRVDRGIVREDLDAALRGVGDDLAAARRDHGHHRESVTPTPQRVRSVIPSQDNDA